MKFVQTNAAMTLIGAEDPDEIGFRKLRRRMKKLGRKARKVGKFAALTAATGGGYAYYKGYKKLTKKKRRGAPAPEESEAMEALPSPDAAEYSTTNAHVAPYAAPGSQPMGSPSAYVPPPNQHLVAQNYGGGGGGYYGGGGGEEDEGPEEEGPEEEAPEGIEGAFSKLTARFKTKPGQPPFSILPMFVRKAWARGVAGRV